tara:strand:- start:175 stop:393 length:219 start_codon:yes stop_codon:yes gene_type:complete
MEQSGLARMLVDSEGIELLEAALLDYVEQFGLSPKARLALVSMAETSYKNFAFQTFGNEEHRQEHVSKANDD